MTDGEFDQKTFDRVRSVVQDLAYYVGQGLTSKEADIFTRRALLAAGYKRRRK